MNEILIQLDVNLIISICAIVISIVSIIIGVRYNRKTFEYQKNQDKLTTEPHLSITMFMTNDGHKIEVTNNGFGPSILIDLKFTFNDFQYDNLIELYANHFKEIKAFVVGSTVEYYLVNGRTSLSAGGSLVLFTMKFKDNFDETNFLNFLTGVKIKIIYSNIYNDLREIEEPLHT